MEVLVAPKFNIEASSPPSQEKHKLVVVPPATMLLKHEERSAEEESSTTTLVNHVRSVKGGGGDDGSDDSSSSIGVPDDSDEEAEEEVSSKGAFDTLDSLQDTLNIKRGLSNYFNGKSKSFRDLSEVNCVGGIKELEKQENPFNKRRRLVMANKYCFSTTLKHHHKNKSTNFYTWSDPKSMPLLTLVDEDGSDDHEKLQQNENLQQHEEEEEDGSKFKPYQSCLDLHELQEYQ